MGNMTERSWTEAQQIAIDTRDKTLLISAAAGSGKTATLTERIIRSLLDKDAPMKIEDMLIVTFTRAAAAELRERIGKAIREATEKNPEDAALQRQLYMLPMAKISTIDAFCIDILRANCDTLGISPSFRIIDGAEAAIMAENILDGIFSAIYDGELGEVATPEEMQTLAQSLTNMDKEAQLSAIFFKIYESTIYREEGAEALLPLVEEFCPDKFSDVENTGYGSYVMGRVKEMAEHYRKIFQKAGEEIRATGSPKLTALADQQTEMAELFARILNIESYNEMRELLRGLTLANAKSNTDPTLPPTTALRKRAKSELEDITKKFFCFTEEDWLVAYRGLYKSFSVLLKIIKTFERLLREEKMRRGAFEFSDVLRLCYECLWHNGELTDVALSERKKYSAVYIDEYQDVNGLQDKVFEAISRENNRFMVGDIKQSIYAFRSAKADIFARIKKEYPPISEAGESSAATVFMSENFRCDRGVVDFVNLIFDKIFSVLGDSIGYMEGDRLKFAKIYEKEEPEYRRPLVTLLDLSSYVKSHRLLGTMKMDPKYPTSALSTALVARKIKELIEGEKKNDGTPITPGDIAIIMRKGKGRVQEYRDALAECGIPAVYAEGSKFFASAESMLVLSLLSSINNPREDVHLAGLMMSPLYDFTADDMTLISAERADCLYDRVMSYTAAHPDFKKGRDFLDSLNRYRLLAEGMPADELIIRLCHESGLLALCARRGTEDKLLRLYEYSRSFEKSRGGGLYNFITYLNGIAKRESSLDKKEAPIAENEVSIITAHGSKGLEYPVVFFVGAEDTFGFRPFGEAPRFEYQEDFGMGMFLRTPSGLSLVRNPTKDIILDYRHRMEVEEEARLLYVILTRARERLYVVGAPRSNLDDYLTEKEIRREYFDSYTVYSSKDYLDLILGAVEVEITDPSDFVRELPEVFTDKPRDAQKCASADELTESEDEDSPTLDPEQMRRRFAFRYSKEAVATLPGKLSVSVLYPEILDGAYDDAAEAEEIAERTKLKYSSLGLLPEFITGRERDLEAKRGIATHMMMQFCDLEKLYLNGAAAELERLLKEKYLSEKDAERVIVEEAELFRSSSLLRRMREARKLYRELRFNVKLPADMFATDSERRAELAGEEILVQGVIDCLFEGDDGELHLIDYKTDRLTREELADKELAAKKLGERHSLQLGYYAKAMERIFGKYPKTVEVYSMPLGDTVEIDVSEADHG